MIIGNKILRQTLRHLLSEQIADLTIIESGREEDHLVIIRKKSPDLVLIDEFPLYVACLGTIKHVKELFPDIPVIFLTRHEREVYQSLATDAGADACVLKNQLSSVLIPTILRLLGE